MCVDYSWILRDGFECLRIETCLFFAIFCLCIFVILMDLFKSYFSSFFNRIILLEFFIYVSKVTNVCNK